MPLLASFTRYFQRLLPRRGPLATSPTLPAAPSITLPAGQEQLPGELWLRDRTSGRPVRALPASLYETEHSSNKLVLGQAGAGCTLLVARLCRAAHDAGNLVVMVCMRARRGPLQYLATELNAQVQQVGLEQQSGFNPFWYPAPEGNTWLMPTPDAIYHDLANVLWAVLHDSPQAAPAPDNAFKHLRTALARYYQLQQWRPFDGPGFNSFYEFLAQLLEPEASRVEPIAAAAEAQEFLHWLRSVGQPYYAGGSQDSLLNALPHQVREMIRPRNRMLLLEVAANYGYGFPNDSPTNGMVCLLLHALDVHRACQHPQKMTVVLDELDGEFSAAGTSFLEGYLNNWRPSNREVISSWHIRIDFLFRAELPSAIALLILRNAGCVLLLASGSRGNEAAFAALGFGPQLEATYISMSSSKREVMVQMATNITVYNARLTLAELRPYVSPEHFSRLVERQSVQDRSVMPSVFIP